MDLVKLFRIGGICASYRGYTNNSNEEDY